MVVVGNLTVGGTGKTPLVLWTVARLREAGYRPGVVTRGYGGRAPSWPQRVAADSDPVRVGDEAVLLARRGGCPVAAAPDRVAAARLLTETQGCDVVVADDGLQHYRLARAVEVVVVDGERRLGNGRCLPAGPLREPRGRLRGADFVVVRGQGGAGEWSMDYLPGALRRVADDATAGAPEAGSRVHGVAGIGAPGRFFAQLRALGWEVVEHPFPDHHPFRPGDLDFAEPLPVIMTEKDAVKCAPFAAPQHWYLPVTARAPAALARGIIHRLENSHG